MMDETAIRQAAHFDTHVPISPWPEVLRKAGFRYHYIAKDLVMKRALDDVSLAPGMKALDVGCGVGVWLDRLESTYGTAGIGIDVSQKSLEFANSQAMGNSSFAMADAKALPFADGAFDLITSLDVLEHIEQPDRALYEMMRVSASDGRLLVYAVSKRYKFTYQWMERGLATLFGIDLHKYSCHDPELLVDPDLARGWLKFDDASLVEMRYFHAFFSSLFDRILLVVYLILKKSDLLSARSSLQLKFGTMILSIASLLSRISVDALLWMDRPWLKRGYSNGFLAIVRKGQG